MFKYKPSFLMVSCFEAYPSSEPVRTFASGRREVVLVIVNCGLSNLVFAGGWSGFYFCICNCAVCQLLIAHRTLAW